MVDVIVIGAGPAGATVAKIVAQSEFDVQIIEKRNPFQTKACGGSISARLAKELSLDDNVIEKLVSYEIHYFPWSKRTRTVENVTVRREIFDRFLVDNAVKHGAKVTYESKVVHVKHKNAMQVSVKNLKDGEVSQLSCKIVVFADGPLTLAQNLFQDVGFQGNINNLAMAARYELEWKKNDMNHYEIFYGPDVSSWGYSWIFPQKNSLNVGVGCPLLILKRQKRKITQILNFFVRKRRISSERLRDKRILNFGAGLIPLAPARKIFGSSCLVVGDAAGMVDPLLGCGIDNAVLAAQMAGRVAVEALQKRDFSENFLSKYQYMWEKSPNYSQIKRGQLITRAMLPFSRFDKNLFARIGYLLHFVK